MDRLSTRRLFVLLLMAFFCALPAQAKNAVINGAFELGNTQFKNDYWTMEGFTWGNDGCNIDIPANLLYPGLNTTWAFWATPVDHWMYGHREGFILQQIFIEAGRTYRFEADVHIYNC